MVAYAVKWRFETPAQIFHGEIGADTKKPLTTEKRKKDLENSVIMRILMMCGDDLRERIAAFPEGDVSVERRAATMSFMFLTNILAIALKTGKPNQEALDYLKKESKMTIEWESLSEEDERFMKLIRGLNDSQNS